MRVTLYSKPGCHLCEDVRAVLDRLAPQYGLEVAEVNILEDPALYEAYGFEIPVLDIEDGRLGRLKAPIDEATLRTALDVARRGPQAGESVLTRPKKEPWIDRLAAYIGRHWLRLAVIFMAVFVGLPWLAPVFAALDWWGVADPIYTAYALTCHQLPERAGNVLGYQVAFCYRNTALYGGVALFGIVYGLARTGRISWLRALKQPIPWWVAVIFLLPMAVDGFTHMFGLREVPVDGSFGTFYIGSQPFSLNWWLRIITGLLAALGVVWFAFPRMERSVNESEAMRLAYRRTAVAGPQQAAGSRQ